MHNGENVVKRHSLASFGPDPWPDLWLDPWAAWVHVNLASHNRGSKLATDRKLVLNLMV